MFGVNTSDRADPARAPHRLLALVCIAALAAVLRFVGIDFGAPSPQCRPDEELVLNEAIFRLSGDPHFHMHLYPPGLMILEAAWIRAGEIVGLLPETRALDYVENPIVFHVAVRSLCALFSTATVLVVGLWMTRRTSLLAGVAAASALAVMPVAVLDGHFATLDAPGTFFFTLATVFAFRDRGRPKLGDLIAAGAAAGFAAAVKFPHGAALLMPLALSFQLERRLKSATCIAVAFAAGFLLLAPTFVLQFSDAIEGVRIQFLEQKVIGSGWTTGEKWSYFLRVTIWRGFGPGISIVALLGIIQALRRDRAILVQALPFMLLIAVHAQGLVFSRYLLPLTTTAACFFGFGIEALRVDRRLIVPSLALFLSLPWSLVPSIESDRRLMRPDSRGQLIESFIEGRLPADLPILAPTHYVLPYPYSWQMGKLELYAKSQARVGCKDRAAIVQRLHDDVEARRGGAWPPCVHLIDASNWQEVIGRFKGRSILLIKTRGPFGVFAWLESIWNSPIIEAAMRDGNLRRIALFDPLDGRPFPDRSHYEPNDYWYLPFPDPTLVERTGPRIEVWRLDVPE